MPWTRYVIPLFIATVHLSVGCESHEYSWVDPSQGLARWQAVEEMRTGSTDDPDAGFSSIGGMVLGPDSLLYVLESIERQVRVFGIDGHRLLTFGRRGAGPGEFEQPNNLGVVGDTVWVAETMGNRRVTLFQSDGTLIGTVPALNQRFTGRSGRLWVEVMPAALQSGGVLTSTYLYTAGGAAGDTVIFPRVLFNLRGEVIDTIGWDTVGMGRSGPQMTVDHVTASVPSRPLLFNDAPVRAVEGRVVVERPIAAGEGPGTFTVTSRSQAGETVWQRVFSYTPISASNEQREREFAAAGAAFRSGGADSLLVDRAVRAALDLPLYLPPVTQVRVVGDEIWIRRENTGGPWQWLVLNRDGEPSGTFELPHSVRPRIFAPRAIWGIDADEFDVPWIVRYRIDRP